MRSILLHVENTSAFEDRFQYALDLARHFGGHLSCFQGISLETMVTADFAGVGTGMVLDSLRQAADEHRAKVEAALAQEDVPWDWETAYGREVANLQRKAALADVVVMGPLGWGKDGRGASPVVAELVLAVETPILFVPHGFKSFDATLPALAAWNGSREAGNALRFAVPLLREAGAVYLASVEEPSKDGRVDLPDTDGAAYLSRHGISSTIVELDHSDGTVAHTLVRAAKLRDCGLIVMGAYGHSRLAELLLGGVTRSMLTEPPLPLLLAH